MTETETETETTHQEIFRATGVTIEDSVATGDPSITIVAGLVVTTHVATTEEAAAVVVEGAVMVIAPTTGTAAGATVTNSNPMSTTAPKEGALTPARPASAPGAAAAPTIPASPLLDHVTLARPLDPRPHDDAPLGKLPQRIQRARAHQTKKNATARKPSPNLLRQSPRSCPANGRA